MQLHWQAEWLCSRVTCDRAFVPVQLCRGVSAEEADQYRLPADPMHEFNYLNQSGCSSIEGVDDASDFAMLKAAMLAVGINKQQQTEVQT